MHSNLFLDNEVQSLSQFVSRPNEFYQAIKTVGYRDCLIDLENKINLFPTLWEGPQGKMLLPFRSFPNTLSLLVAIKVSRFLRWLVPKLNLGKETLPLEHLL